MVPKITLDTFAIFSFSNQWYKDDSEISLNLDRTHNPPPPQKKEILDCDKYSWNRKANLRAIMLKDLKKVIQDIQEQVTALLADSVWQPDHSCHSSLHKD